MIEEAQVVLHKGDEPDFIAHLLDTDILAGEEGAEMDLSAPEADAAALSDGNGSVVERVVKLAEPAIGAGRALVELSGIFHGERLVRALGVEALDEVVELRLLLQEVLCGRLGGLFLQGQVREADR